MRRTGRFRITCGTALLAVLGVVGPGLAAEVDTTSAPPAEASPLLKKLNEQRTVRVRCDWGRAVLAYPRFARGTVAFGALSEFEPVSGDSGSRPELLSWSEIEKIETRGSAAGTGSLIGACVGFAGGVAAGIALAHIDVGLGSSDPTSSEVLRAALLGGAGGALVGAALGAIVGSTIPKWHTAYERTAEKPSFPPSESRSP